MEKALLLVATLLMGILVLIPVLPFITLDDVIIVTFVLSAMGVVFFYAIALGEYLENKNK